MHVKCGAKLCKAVVYIITFDEILTYHCNCPGSYECKGFNQLPGSAKTVTNSKIVNIIIMKDVAVTIAPSATETEVSYGDDVTFSCTAEGGRTPHILQVMLQGKYLVNYNTDKGAGVDDVTKSGHQVTYKKDMKGVDYTNDGTYNCTAKNKAKGGVEKSDTKTSTITVGMLALNPITTK